ncbi:17-beta-hydroxysteroid dehydrogenase type 1-like [Diadema antillarum]|uniref:17-beta-hydroxysteroid dehydrogenase type 1-like n=1 Tax=Diadema antillarum TaxID=105358 RepID=UPI003A847695
MSKQIVLLTGGLSGIGLAVAERLAKDSEKRFLVIATVISMSEKGDLVNALGDALDSTAFIEELDITNDDSIASVVESVIAKHGRIDILMNIAGVQVFGVVDQISRKQVDLAFNVNTIGTIRLTQSVLPHMKRQMAGKSFRLRAYTACMVGIPLAPCVIEPAGVQTPLLDGIIQSLQKVGTGESGSEIDQAKAAKNAEVLGGGVFTVPMEDVVATFMKIVEDPKPALRHPVFGAKRGGLDFFSDPTAEQYIAAMKTSECSSIIA